MVLQTIIEPVVLTFKPYEHAGRPCRVITIPSDWADRRNRDRSFLTSTSATGRIGRPVPGKPARRFGFRDDRQDLGGFLRGIIEDSHLPPPEPILRLAQAPQALDQCLVVGRVHLWRKPRDT